MTFLRFRWVFNGFLMGLMGLMGFQWDFNGFQWVFNGFLMEWNGIIIHSMGDTLWETKSLRTGR